MLSLLKYYIEVLFCEYNPIRNKKRHQKDMKRIREKARLALFQIISAVFLVLVSATIALSQESQPKLKFSQPSDEMDFTIPPVPSLPEVGDDQPPPDDDLYGFGDPSSDSEGEPFIDQFFSTTTIVGEEQQEEKPEPVVKEPEPEIKEEPKPVVKKPRATYQAKFKRYDKPKHRFDSVLLPDTIYHKDYSRLNRHLPESYLQSDQQAAVAAEVKANNVTKLRSLFKNNADIMGQTPEGTPYVVLAAQHNSVDVLRWLLMYKVDANAADAYGLTALHYAAYNGNAHMVELLLMYGADKTLVDNKGSAPLEYAQNRAAPSNVINMLYF